MVSKKICLGLALILAPVASSFAAVSAEEAKQLGNNLTPWGAEKAGNAAGTIPEWTGQPKAPANYKPGSGRWPNPFANEKPLFSITAKNMQQYAGQLTDGQKELLKRYPSYRMDIYPSHRTHDQPKDINDACLKNAVTAETFNGGVSLKNTIGCIPFPIPKTGYEAMWNHQLPWRSRAFKQRAESWYVDGNGRQTQTLLGNFEFTFPFSHVGATVESVKADYNNSYYINMQEYIGPARLVGEGVHTKYNIDPIGIPNRTWSYQPGQRRVRAAPDTFYDFPVAQLGGAMTYDDVTLFLGAMDRFNFKLVGKKEMYIPYNSYDYYQTPSDKLLGKNHLNPDMVRWELHRTWVIESTLKPEYRHVYSKRVYYLDEDNAAVGIADLYDTSGKLYRFTHSSAMQLFDEDKSSDSISFGSYDFSNGVYMISTVLGGEGFFRPIKPSPKSTFTPQYLQTLMQR